jgi:hypothetical protein
VFPPAVPGTKCYCCARAPCPLLSMLRTPVVVPRLWVPKDLPLQRTSTKTTEHAATRGLPCTVLLRV